MKQFHLTVKTKGRGMIDITPSIIEFINQSQVEIGLCNIFIHHTSASILINENYEPSVQDDLETFVSKIAPDGDPTYQHTTEGPDDMASHIRTILTDTSINIPISHYKLALGRWQGIFLWEHRLRGNERKLTITIAD